MQLFMCDMTTKIDNLHSMGYWLEHDRRDMPKWRLVEPGQGGKWPSLTNFEIAVDELNSVSEELERLAMRMEKLSHCKAITTELGGLLQGFASVLYHMHTDIDGEGG